MIKVLMVGNHPSNKGGMTSVINQIKNHDWAKEDIEMSFIPTFFPGNPVVKILYFGLSCLRIIARFIFSKPDIVHMHMSYKGSFTRKYFVHRLCRLFHVRDVIHLHGSEFEDWYNQLGSGTKQRLKKLLFECDGFIVLGEKIEKVILKIEPNTKVTVINNGIQIPEQVVQWNDQYCQVLFLGVLILRKGVSDLIKAVELIKDENKTDNLRVVIAGVGEDESRLNKQVQDADLSEVISFAGWVAGREKEDLILQSQVFVLPSYNEGLPIAILEAGSYGMPIISTEVGEIGSVVKNGINGFLVTPGDTAALAKGIMELTDRKTFETMSAASRKMIKESFSVDLFYRTLLAVYKGLGDDNG